MTEKFRINFCFVVLIYLIAIITNFCKLSEASESCDSEAGYHPCGPETCFYQLNETCCGGAVNSFVEGGICCNETVYIPSKSTCCQGNVFHELVQCCGQKALNASSEICCDNEVLSSETHGCCKETGYDRSTSVCCYSEGLDTYSTGKGDGCCGPEGLPYSSASQICCNNHLFDTFEGEGETFCCDEKAYSSETQVCCQGQLYDAATHECCNSEVFEKSKQTCCYSELDELFRIQEGTLCCGATGTGFDGGSHVCCDGNIQPKVGGEATACCGSTSYDIKSGKCCGEKVYESNFDCCGTVGFDTSSHVCCWNETLNHYGVQDGDSCCGIYGASYFKSEGKCCDGAVSRIENANQKSVECCQRKAYDTGSSMCCGSEVISTLEGFGCCGNVDSYDTNAQSCCWSPFYEDYKVSFGTRCCGSKGDAYDPVDSLCCNGNIVPKPTFPAELASPDSEPIDAQCCGNQTFNPNNQLCCNNNVVNNGDKGGCCAGVPYSKSTHACCWDEEGVNYKLSKGKVCCGDLGKAYFEDSQICCSGKIRKRQSNSTSCCGKKSFDPSKSESCCNEKVMNLTLQGCCAMKQIYDKSSETCCWNDKANSYKKAPGLQCCGNGGAAFDPATQVCCQGKVFDQTNGGGIECCGGETFNSKTQTCCGSKLIDATSSGCCGQINVYDLKTQSCCYDSAAKSASVQLGDKCCGNSGAGFNSKESLCCNGNVQPLHNGVETFCCNQSSYDPSTQVCCNSEIFPADTHQCCSTSSGFSKSTNVCCFNSLENAFVVGNGDLCCGESGEAYYANMSTCCNGVVSAGNELTSQCCGNIGYNPESKICCNSEIFDKETHDCCGGLIPFDANARKCCFNSVESKFVVGKGTECCGVTGATFYQSTQFCCNGNVIDMVGETNTNTQCCGNKIYNIESEICCSHEVVNMKTHGCCQGQSYKLSEKTCCQDDADITESVNAGETHSKLSIKTGNTCCKSEGYFSNISLCCQDKIVEKTNGESHCCGKSAFNPIKQICCNFLPLNADEFGCCEGKPYIKSEEVCCLQGKESVIERGDRCCGELGKGYDSSKYACCAEQVVEKVDKSSQCCGEFSYNPAEQFCCKNVVGQISLSGCCGSDLFNRKSQVCCYDHTSNVTNLYIVQDGDSCCGSTGKGYNSELSVCCDGVISESKGKSTQCCGNASFNPSEQFCCANVVKEKNNFGCCAAKKVYAKKSQACCENKELGDFSVSNGTSCCGETGKAFHPDTQLCCGNEILHVPNSQHKCCGKQTFDSSLNFCCNSEVFLLSSHGCCNSQPFKKDSEVCCWDKKEEKLSPSSGTECCGSSGTGYDPEIQECCDEQVVDKSGDAEQQCCGAALIDVSSSKCCNDTVISVDEGCCDDGPYDLQSQTCCWNSIDQQHNIGDGDKCCGELGEPYYASKSICCHGTVTIKLGTNTSCCGTQMFDESNNVCCGEQLFDISSHKCCGDNSFKIKDQICCYDHDSETFRVGDGNKCCGKKGDAFYEYKQMCCAGVTNEREGVRAECCGTKAFDAEVETCCGGEVLDKSGEGCCGSKSYSTESQTCCTKHANQTVANVLIVPGDSCCGTNGAGYFSDKSLCCNGIVIHKPANGRMAQCCGETAYDPEEQICCTGIVGPKSTHQCCNGGIFRKDNETCCWNNIRNKYVVSAGNQCCGTEGNGYFQGAQICCQGSLVDFLEGAEMECCGATAIDAKSQRCCGDSPVDKVGMACCQGKPYETATHTCCLQEKGIYHVQKGKACCNGNGYDVLTEICCKGVLQSSPMGQSATCCGELAYNHKTQICCGMKVREKSTHSCCSGLIYKRNEQQCCFDSDSKLTKVVNGDACCNSLGYNSSLQICCKDKIVDRFSDQNEVQTDAVSRILQCCGDHGYHPATQLCCGEGVYDSAEHSCCGNEAFKKATQTCCWDGLANTYAIGDGNACCGSVAFDRVAQTCCNKIVQQSQGPDTRCCGTQSYNSRDMICCAENLYDAKTHRCCGEDGAYNKKTETCCFNDETKIYAIGEGNQCCGPTGYNTTSQICCQSAIQKRQGSNTRCCGDASYDAAKAICCEFALFDFDSEESRTALACCGAQKYNRREHFCCNTTIHAKADTGISTDCCGDSIYNTATDLCCDSTVHEGAGTTGQKCCGRGLYDTSSGVSFCCDNVVVINRTLERPPMERMLAVENSISNRSCDFYHRLQELFCYCGPHTFVMSMGYKYCQAFFNVRDQFDDKGWQDRVRTCLQTILYRKITRSKTWPSCDQIGDWGKESLKLCYNSAPEDPVTNRVGPFCQLSNDDRQKTFEIAKIEIWDSISLGNSDISKCINEKESQSEESYFWR